MVRLRWFEPPFPGRRPGMHPESVPVRRSPAPTRALPNGTESALRETKPGEPRRNTRLRPPNARREKASASSFRPDPETGVAPGFTRCRNMRSRCRCSMCPAIHINSRSWLRSSSTHEPSDPPLRVVSRHTRQQRFPSRSREALESGARAELSHRENRKTVV